MAVILARELAEGMQIRWWQGLAWHEVDRAIYRVYPVPLNLFVRWVRDCWRFLQVMGSPKEQEASQYQQGWRDGYEKSRLEMTDALDAYIAAGH